MAAAAAANQCTPTRPRAVCTSTTSSSCCCSCRCHNWLTCIPHSDSEKADGGVGRRCAVSCCCCCCCCCWRDERQKPLLIPRACKHDIITTITTITIVSRSTYTVPPLTLAAATAAVAATRLHALHEVRKLPHRHCCPSPQGICDVGVIRALVEGKAQASGQSVEESRHSQGCVVVRVQVEGRCVGKLRVWNAEHRFAPEPASEGVSEGGSG